MAFQITWYGHATLGLKTGEYRILVDPFFTRNPVATVKPEQVHADFILVTHGHGDHLGDTIAIAKHCNSLVIANDEISKWLAARNVRTHSQHLGGGYLHPFGYVKLTFALHGSALPDGSYGGNPAGFLITTGNGEKIYFAGDTGLFGDMALIGEEGVDLALLPIGDNYTMGPADALRAVKLLNPRHVVPIHYNTFDLIRQDARAWARQVERETQTVVHLMQVGDTLDL